MAQNEICFRPNADFFIVAGAQSADELEVQYSTLAKRKAVAAKVSSIRDFSSGGHERDIAILRVSFHLFRPPLPYCGGCSHFAHSRVM